MLYLCFMEENRQYVVVPHDMTTNSELEPKDLVVYAAIAKFKNKDTNESFPGLRTISQICCASVNTIKNSIDKLVSSGYISVSKKKNANNVYTFNKVFDDNFEVFSHKFLSDTSLSFMEKAYLIASQQFMFKSTNGEVGVIKFQNFELASKIKMPYSTLCKCNKSLESKELLTIIGASEKIFKIKEFNQAVMWVLTKHEEEIDKLRQADKEKDARIRKLEKEIRRLKSFDTPEQEIIL